MRPPLLHRPHHGWPEPLHLIEDLRTRRDIIGRTARLLVASTPLEGLARGRAAIGLRRKRSALAASGSANQLPLEADVQLLHLAVTYSNAAHLAQLTLVVLRKKQKRQLLDQLGLRHDHAECLLRRASPALAGRAAGLVLGGAADT